jgi:glycosyltransferase involved in cell wall biosynthesis
VNPKISVIIPAYNAEKYLAETIESVLTQTYDNHEVIAVDDGSTDDTLRVLRSFEPQITVLSKPNGGPATARNMAIRNSTGEYLAFLDSDDIWTKDKLREQAGFLVQHPEIGLLFSEALMFVVENGEKKILKKIGYTVNPTFCSLLWGNYIPNSTVVIRRSCLDQIGLLNENRDLIASEDYEYWMRIARRFSIAGIAKPLAYYRVREDGLMGDSKDIDKWLRLTLAAVAEVEKIYPQMWAECGIDRNKLFARMHIRAGFAWKQSGDWKECFLRFGQALSISKKPRVIRWIIAAALLKRWS